MIWWWLLACRPPPDAPEEVGDLGRYLFAHFDDDDPDALAAGVSNLAAVVLAQDLTAEVADRAVSMPVLRPVDLGSLRLPDGTSADDQVGVAASGVSAYPLDQQLTLLLDPVQTCIESAITVWAGRTFETDPGCFYDGCDALVTANEVRRDNPVLKVWYDQPKTYRALSLQGDGVDALVGRAHIDRVFEGDSGANEWRQLFHLDVFVADGDRTIRWFASWSEIAGLLVGDDVLANMTVAGVEEALGFGDELIGGLPSTCPHDRDAPRPDRP